MPRKGLYLLTLVAMTQLATAQQTAVTIVVLGSSSVEGNGPTDPNNAWVNRYRVHAQSINPGNQVINLGNGGSNTADITTTGDPVHNITAALSNAPDGIIISMPSNDAVGLRPVADQLANYDNVMAAADAAGVPVWVTTTGPRNAGSSGWCPGPYGGECKALLMEMRDSTYSRWGDHAIDIWTGLADTAGNIVPMYDCGDGVHLNDTAHALLVQRVIDKHIVEQLAGASNSQDRHHGTTITVPRRASTPLWLYTPAGRRVEAEATARHAGCVSAAIGRATGTVLLARHNTQGR